MPTGTYKRKQCSEETKRKIGLANSRPKISIVCLICSKEFFVSKSRYMRGEVRFCSRKCFYLKKRTPWNKGKTGLQIAWNKGKKMVFKHPMLGKKHTPEARLKITLAQLGKPKYNQRGEKSHRWKGGKTSEVMRLRNSLDYKIWRREIYKRDNYTCLWCGQRGGRLNADHIKPFALFPELRFELSNGRTLCISCHYKTDTWGGNSNQKAYEKKSKKVGSRTVA